MAKRGKNELNTSGDAEVGSDKLSLREARDLFVRELRIFAKATQRHHRSA